MPKLLIKQVLEKKSMTKYQLAKRLKIEYNAVFRYFRPSFNPTLGTLERLANALGCRIRDLYEEPKQNRKPSHDN
jgi:transcriptional regulator with XRE-family HTH domain